MTRWARFTLMAALAGVLSGCAARQAIRPDYDPWQGFNRKIFWFNDKLDVYALEPLGKAWDFAVPKPAQLSVTSFFTNLRFPISASNNLLQGKWRGSATETGRFAINTTLGFLGLFDTATPLGLEARPEDFGQTLGWWGVPAGPYLVLPFFGASNPRDTAGLGADYAMRIYPFFVGTTVEVLITSGANGVDIVNTRASFLKEVEDAKSAALDYYVFVRNAYIQRRNALVNDSNEVERSNAEDLYEVPEDE